MFYHDKDGWIVNNDLPDNKELKILHSAIKKISDDMERYSFNTIVSHFMIMANELHRLGCHKKEILLPVLVMLQPYAPHVAEELYSQLIL